MVQGFMLLMLADAIDLARAYGAPNSLHVQEAVLAIRSIWPIRATQWPVIFIRSLCNRGIVQVQIRCCRLALRMVRDEFV